MLNGYEDEYRDWTREMIADLLGDEALGDDPTDEDLWDDDEAGEALL